MAVIGDDDNTELSNDSDLCSVVAISSSPGWRSTCAFDEAWLINSVSIKVANPQKPLKINKKL